MSAREITKALEAVIDGLWLDTHEKARGRKSVREALDGYRILAPDEIDPVTLEAAAKVADAADTEWNAVAYDRRQAGRDDNFACASASSATKIATAIRSLRRTTSNGGGDAE